MIDYKEEKRSIIVDIMKINEEIMKANEEIMEVNNKHINLLKLIELLYQKKNIKKLELEELERVNELTTID